MVSLRECEVRFESIKLKPACEVDPDAFKGLQCEVMGYKLPSPIAIASTAFHKMAHWEGETGSARAANKFKTPFMLSSWANTSNEEVSQAAPDSLKMYQVYLSKFPEVNKDIFRRVRESGFKMLMLTTDTQQLGKRDQDVRNGFQLPSHLRLENLAKYLNDTSSIKSKNESGLAEFARNHKQNNIGWDVIPSVKQDSGLKVIAKGVMCYEDALEAIKYEVDGIMVSNHGARQLDTTPATIDVLAEVVKAVKDSGKKVPVFFDGGVRRGSDILKALAIGADLVFIGRPVLWGLATNG